MKLDAQDIKEIMSIAKPFIDVLVKTFWKPKLDFLVNRGNLDKKASNEIDKIVKEYLFRAYQKYSIINVLVFPNQQIELKKVYQPLTLELARDHQIFKVETFDRSIMDQYSKIIIADSAGMGKSTLAKWISLSLIEQGISIPILIELKKLSKNHSILDEIIDQLTPIGSLTVKEHILKILEDGGFTIILDGFDEITFGQKKNVIANLKDFISKAYKNWFILTSRPESSLSTFGDFQLFHISGLVQEESFALISKYDKISKLNIRQKLINDIKDKNDQVREFLTNPFMVSLLYKTYTYNRDIPSKKMSFYEEVYTSLYKHHDLSKDGFQRNKKSGLDIEDFRRMLRQLAFDTAKLGKIEYTPHQLVKHLKEAKSKWPGINFKDDDFIEDLELNVPLFVRDGNLLKWSHKSLQDFFAAEFISDSNLKVEIIVRIIQLEKDTFMNILDFLYEMEYKVFRNTIIKSILNRFMSYCAKSYKSIKLSNKQALLDRQSISFGIKFGFIHGDDEVIDDAMDTTFPEILGDERMECYTTVFGGKMFGTYYNMSFDMEIFELLTKHKEDLFLKSTTYRAPYGNTLFKFPINTAHILNEDKNNLVNSPKLFNEFNQWFFKEFENAGIRHSAFLDHAKCAKYLHQIIKDEDLDKAGNTLDDL